MTELPTYSFLPWLRQGLANSVQEDESTPNPALRAGLDVELTLRSQGVNGTVSDRRVTRRVQLYGPGDVIGIDAKAIIKTEPRHFITNFEPNYLAHIEFYDEDFPWRYTPARPDPTHHRQRPWIMLVVLEEGEFRDGDARGKSLPFIDIAALEVLPPIDQLWAWAHVQVNRDLGGDDGERLHGPEIAARLSAVLNENADLAFSRILCPRKLEANKAYHAFLIPTFETGRVAGLGLDVSKVDDAMRGAWQAHPERPNLLPNSFPYYHRFYFRTGNAGDFEYLVRLLTPKPLDARVGYRELDVQTPYAGIEGVKGPLRNGVLRLGGALKVPRTGPHLGTESRGAPLRRVGRACAPPVPNRPRRLHQPRGRLRDQATRARARRAPCPRGDRRASRRRQ